MRTLTRLIAAAGAAPVLALSLTACGGEAPTDAAVEEFCAANEETDSLPDDIGEEDYEGFVEAGSEVADQLTEVGTPEGIPDEAREGFEALTGALSDLDASAMEDAVTEMREAAGDDPGETVDQLGNTMTQIFGISEEDVDKVIAFQEYRSETCSG